MTLYPVIKHQSATTVNSISLILSRKNLQTQRRMYLCNFICLSRYSIECRFITVLPDYIKLIDIFTSLQIILDCDYAESVKTAKNYSLVFMTFLNKLQNQFSALTKLPSLWKAVGKIYNKTINNKTTFSVAS